MSNPPVMLKSLMPTKAAVERQPAQQPAAPAQIEDPPDRSHCLSRGQGRPQANRVGRVMVAGYFGTETSFGIRELCVKMSRKRGRRVTLQDALAEAIALLFEKNGVAPPDEVSELLNS